MEFTQQPGLTQKQNQTYLPHLVQGVQLLQLNRLELSAYLEQQIADNPFLDVPQKERELLDSALGGAASVIEQTAASRQSLYEFLKEQIMLFYRDTPLRRLAFWWLNQLDHRGYATKTMDEAKKETGASFEELLDALTLLQQLDPPGIGARNLQECLMLQTERLEWAPAIAYIVLEEHFEDLAERNWQNIADQYNVSIEDIQQVYGFIQRLSPSPGEALDVKETPFVLPELSVSLNDGTLTVTETEFKTPLLSFNTAYFNEMKSSADDNETKKYLKQKQQEYENLQMSLKKRKETLLQVGTAVVLHQRAFFENKERSLVPLQLANLAEECQLSVSTISRAVRETYIQTPAGIYELKSFLSRRTTSDSVSKDQVTNILKQLIQSEDKTRPYSDQALSDALKEKSIDLSRRAVTKYRKQLEIPSSTKRKIR